VGLGAPDDEGLGDGLGPVLGLSEGSGVAVGGGVARSARIATAQAGSGRTATPLWSAAALSFPYVVVGKCVFTYVNARTARSRESAPGSSAKSCANK
jgi:hypothetical protein